MYDSITEKNLKMAYPGYMVFDDFNDRYNSIMLAIINHPGFKWAAIKSAVIDKGPEVVAIELYDNGQLFGDELESSIEQATREIRQLEEDGITVATYFSPNYPQQLRGIHNFPPVVYFKGKQQENDHESIAIVGSREISFGAKKFTEDLATALSERNMPIISGLARGVDTIAMKKSLSLHNRTIGVIGTGLYRSYPPENRDLQEEIATNHLLISQFKPDSSPTKASFPMRNVVMSGLSRLTVIVEAGEHSGTRTQANAAVRHGRPVILTRAVYENTDWAKKIVDQYRTSIYVVQTVDEALKAINHSRIRELDLSAIAI